MKSTVFTAALWLMATPALAQVQGLYGSECLKVDGLSAYKDVAFDGETLKQVQTVFADEECQVPAYDFVFEGPYSLDAELGHLDYSFTKIKLTPLSSEVAENFIHHKLCDIDQWQAGKSADIAGMNCGGQLIPSLGVAVYDRISEQTDAIRMGRASDQQNGSAAALRPDQLDAVIYQAK